MTWAVECSPDHGHGPGADRSCQCAEEGSVPEDVNILTGHGCLSLGCGRSRQPDQSWQETRRHGSRRVRRGSQYRAGFVDPWKESRAQAQSSWILIPKNSRSREMVTRQGTLKESPSPKSCALTTKRGTLIMAEAFYDPDMKTWTGIQGESLQAYCTELTAWRFRWTKRR